MQEPPTSLTEARQALRRAQARKAGVRGMREKTTENARQAKVILAENQLARRIRESLT